MNKPLALASLASLALCGGAAGLLFYLPSRPAALAPTPIANAPTPPALAAPARTTPPAPSARPVEPPITSPAPPVPARKPAPAPIASIPSPPADPEPDFSEFAVPLPMARIALAAIGTDDDSLAQAVWLTAINDPSLPAEDREDLIEDLNEEGFADPDNPTHEELPLIQARLAVIDRYESDAMDEVNAAAFKEARKDLTNMRKRLIESAAP